MSKLDHRYRDGVHSYILSLSPEQKRDFEYRLLGQVQFHKRELRDLKEALLEEVQALAFLQQHLHVTPFRRADDPPQEQRQVPATEDKKITEMAARRKSRTA